MDVFKKASSINVFALTYTLLAKAFSKIVLIYSVLTRDSSMCASINGASLNDLSPNGLSPNADFLNNVFPNDVSPNDTSPNDISTNAPSIYTAFANHFSVNASFVNVSANNSPINTFASSYAVYSIILYSA